MAGGDRRAEASFEETALGSWAFTGDGCGA